MKKTILLSLFFGLLMASQPAFGIVKKLDEVPNELIAEHVLSHLYKKPGCCGVDHDRSIIFLSSLRLVSKDFNEFVIYLFSSVKPVGFDFQKLTTGEKGEKTSKFIIDNKILIDVSFAGQRSPLCGDQVEKFIEKFKHNIYSLDFYSGDIFGDLKTQNFKPISKCTRLKKLFFEDVATVTDDVFKNLPDCLEKLTVHMTGATAEMLQHLKPLKKLKKLHLGNVPVTGKDLEFLSLYSLESISLEEGNSDCGYTGSETDCEVNGTTKVCITDEALKALKKFRYLKKLRLQGCKRLTDKGLSCVPESVEKIRITRCDKITRAGLALLPKTLQSLEIYSSVGDEDLRVIGQFTQLKTLQLNHHDNTITDKGLKHLKNLHDLSRLDICFARGITYENFEFLPDNIKTLFVDGRETKIADLGKLPASLKELEIQFPVSDEMRLELKQLSQLKRLRINFGDDYGNPLIFNTLLSD